MDDSGFNPKFRAYDEKSGYMTVSESIVVDGEGNYHHHYKNRDGDDEFSFSWFTGWEDRNGDEIFEGDIIRRAQHTAAESEREWLREHDDAPDVGDIEKFVTDYTGALGVVRWEDGGFFIEHFEGHLWAFHGPEGDMASLDELEVIGNIWQNEEIL